jgi:hypothetical protein
MTSFLKENPIGPNPKSNCDSVYMTSFLKENPIGPNPKSNCDSSLHEIIFEGKPNWSKP